MDTTWSITSRRPTYFGLVFDDVGGDEDSYALNQISDDVNHGGADVDVHLLRNRRHRRHLVEGMSGRRNGGRRRRRKGVVDGGGIVAVNGRGVGVGKVVDQIGGLVAEKALRGPPR